MHKIVENLSRAVLFLALLSLTPGCTAQRIHEPEVAVSTHLQRASSLINRYDYAGAEQELGQALLKAPEDASLYLLHGELLQVLGKPAEAAESFRRGRQHSDSETELFITLTHRLGLVEALKLANSQQAEQMLTELPAGSLEHIDLQGAIALHQGLFRQALIALSKAPHVTREPEKIAWIRYHAALAYWGLGDESNSRSALYVAVNYAESLALKYDIEQFWREIEPQNH